VLPKRCCSTGAGVINAFVSKYKQAFIMAQQKVQHTDCGLLPLLTSQATCLDDALTQHFGPPTGQVPQGMLSLLCHSSTDMFNN
jgi:hypothetical protein